MSELKLKDLKVGDKVILSSHHTRTIEVIERITPKGFYCVKGRLFNPNTGRERTSDVWFFSSIYTANEEEIDKIKEENFTKKVFAEMKSLKNISYQQAIEIHKILLKGGDNENI